jgi:ATP-dependent RNA helicase DOB1
MFDPVTRDLIQLAPDLTDLDVERLPEQLTRFYSILVALRIQPVPGETDRSQELIEAIEKLPRLAHAYGALALGKEQEEPSRRSAAFVAATAYRLINAAKRQELIPSDESKFPTASSLPDWITSSLLFLLGGYSSDAFEIASRIDLNPAPEDLALGVLSRALQALAMGNLREIVAGEEISYTDVGVSNPEIDLEDSAVSRIWIRLHKAIRALAMGLLGFSKAGIATWKSDFDWVIEATTAQVDSLFIGGRFRVTSIFAGPHHLARLLQRAAAELWEHALVRVPPPIRVPDDAWDSFLCGVAHEKPFLWPNHLRAIETGYLDKGKSALITAPTGAGKSLLIELKIAAAMLQGMITLYLVPTRALVDQVHRDLDKRLKSISPDVRVAQSLIDEDFYAEIESLEAGVLVMTPERALTILAFDDTVLDNLGLLVFDECHLLHGEEPVPNHRSIDSMLCLTRLLERSDNQLDVILSSAMVRNATELAGWLAEAYGLDVELLTERWKPTRQVRGCLIYQADAIKDLNNNIATAWKSRTTKGPPARLKRQMKVDPYCIFSLKQTWQTAKSDDYAVLPLGGGTMQLGISVQRYDNWMLTANRNNNAAQIAAWFAAEGVSTIVFADQPRTSVSIAKSTGQLLVSNRDVELLPKERELLQCAILEVGDSTAVYSIFGNTVGSHHGQMIAQERILVERLFSRGAIKVIAATPTLAQGMNLPAEAVILAGDDRYDESRGTRKLLKAHEMLNAIGRAGRAGHISTGFVALVPGEIINYSESDNETAIGKRWFELKDEILGQEDNCIDVTDPIERCMDLVLLGEDDTKEIADYFLRRLPAEQDVEAFLQKTLAGYHARTKGKEDEFTECAAAIRTQREMVNVEDQASETIQVLSFDTGVSLALLIDLSDSLPDTALPVSVEDWISWLGDWCDRFPHHVSEAISLQGQRMISTLAEDTSTGTQQSAVKKLFQAVGLWIAGKPLKEIEISFDLSRNSHYLKTARRFAIQVIPRLSFFFGLITAYYRRSGSEDLLGESIGATTLKCLGACIREGFDSPRKLALYHVVRAKRFTSRVEIHSLFESFHRAGQLSEDETVSFEIMLQEATSAAKGMK